MSIIQQNQHQYNTPEAIYNAVCPQCLQPVGFNFIHIGGHARRQPHLVCENPDCQNYIVWRLTEDEMDEYAAYVIDREQASKEWAERLDDDFWTVFMGSEVA